MSTAALAAALKRQALVDAVRNFEANPNGIGTIAWCELGKALLAYEATGDHDHGNKPLPVGAPCPGGDCWVARARKLLVDSTLRSVGAL
jgi:hypothetical protein